MSEGIASLDMGVSRAGDRAGHEGDPSIERRLAAGDPEALAECYRTMAPAVRSYVRRLVPSDAVEDLVQTTFLEVWRTNGSYDHRRPLKPWVLAIARRRAIDHLRRRRPVVALEDRHDRAGDDGRVVAEAHAWATIVRQALWALPDHQREVLELAYFTHLSQPEIARRLQVPLGTVKARTARGLLRLASLLDAREGQERDK